MTENLTKILEGLGKTNFNRLAAAEQQNITNLESLQNRVLATFRETPETHIIIQEDTAIHYFGPVIDSMALLKANITTSLATRDHYQEMESKEDYAPCVPFFRQKDHFVLNDSIYFFIDSSFVYGRKAQQLKSRGMEFSQPGFFTGIVTKFFNTNNRYYAEVGFTEGDPCQVYGPPTKFTVRTNIPQFLRQDEFHYMKQNIDFFKNWFGANIALTNSIEAQNAFEGEFKRVAHEMEHYLAITQ